MEKQIISIDNNRIQKSKIQGEKYQTLLNDFIAKVETECKNSFTDEEKIELKNNAPNFLLNWAKQFFQFPNATEEFNLQALGLDLGTLISEFIANSKHWKHYPYILEGDKFIYDYKTIEEESKSFTTNEFQNDCVNMANELIDLVERGIEKGIISTESHISIKIAEAFRILALNPSDKKHHNLVVNAGIPYLPKF